MKHFKLLLLLTVISFSLAGCKKDCPANHCEGLKTALITGDNTNLQSSIANLINNLPNQEYTEENINALVSSVADQCSITTKVICFNCIMTLPSETEIQLTFTNNQSTISKIIDISHTAENKMKFVSVHD